MTRPIDAEDLKKRYALLMWKEHNPYDTVKVCDVVNQTIDFIDNAPTVEERPQGEQKDIDIPKMCEECHSQSYNNGFDAGYELGKKDAQKHITELNERIEFLMQQIRLWQSWASTEQQGKDSEENMNEQETFIDEKRHQDEWIPIKTRPLTEEEKEEYPDCSFMYDCQMPDDGEEVLITTSNGYVVISTLHRDNNGCYCDLGYDCIERHDVIAWKSKPESYKGEYNG